MNQKSLVSAILVCSASLPLAAFAVPVLPSPTPVAPPRAAAPVAVPPAPASAPAAAAPTALAAAAPAKPEAKLPPPKTPLEAALQGSVMLERAGRPLGVGTLLNGDGRILTALSPLTHGNQIDARYADGHVVHVRLSASDRAWDLALLTPEGEIRHSGLRASRDPAPAVGSKLHTIGYVRDKALGVSEVVIKAQSPLRGGDSAELADALELSAPPKPSDVGAPLVNDHGEVVAVIARACAPSDKVGCTLAPYAAPVTAIRGFLRTLPVRRGPWVGLEAVAFDAGVARGVRVAAIAPEGPAAVAGLRAGGPGMGDVILAVDGLPVATAEGFADAVANHPPGTALRLLVLSEGRYHDVALVAAPNRQDHVIQSNPWPRRRPAPAVPNPYR